MNTHVYSSSSEPVQVLSGRELDREIRTATPTKRALLAADVEAGRLLVERPTARQARLITGASPCYLYAARRLSPLESVRRDHVGLHSFLNMSLMEARRRKASAFRLRFSQSFASRRQRPSHANVRSTTHRFGKRQSL